MQLTIKKQVEETIDVDFPIYKTYAGLNKIISPKSYICIQPENGILEYRENSEVIVQSIFVQGRDLEQSVFDNALQDSLSKFSKLLFESVTTKATEEEIRNNEVDTYQEEPHYELSDFEPAP